MSDTIPKFEYQIMLSTNMSQNQVSTTETIDNTYFQRLNAKQRKISLCFSGIKNTETNSLNYLNFTFGLIFSVIIMAVNIYLWQTSDENHTYWSTTIPIQFVIRILYQICLNGLNIYNVLYVFFTSSYLTFWFAHHRASKYFDEKLLLNIRKCDKFFYFSCLSSLVIFEIVAVILALLPLLKNPSFNNVIFLLNRFYVWHIALAVAFIRLEVFLYGLTSIKHVLQNLQHEITVSMLSESYMLYKKYFLIWKDMYKSLEFAIGLGLLLFGASGWLSIGSILTGKYINAVGVAVTSIVVYCSNIYYLCEQTARFNQLEQRLHYISVEIIENKLGTECYLQCECFKLLLKKNKYSGNVYGYRVSYKGLLIATMYFIVVRFIAYSLEFV
eukprot:313739_1